MLNIFQSKLYVSLFIVVLLIIVALPHFLAPHWVNIAIFTLWFIYLCSAWNLVGGLAGQFCFAHPIFLAAGAYTSTILYLHFGLSPWVGMIPGVIIAVLFGIFMAWLNFRYKLPHLSFALITLGFVYLIYFIIGGLEFMGGHDGLAIIATANLPSKFLFLSKLPYYYIILIMATGIVALSWFVDQTKLGFYLKAMRDNEDAAESIGIDRLKFMLIIMAISAALTAVAGTFYAQYMRYVEPEGIAGPHLVIQMILFTSIGGIGTIWGPVIGPCILVVLGETLAIQLGYKFAGMNHMIYGVIVVLVILFMPRGIVGWFRVRYQNRP